MKKTNKILMISSIIGMSLGLEVGVANAATNMNASKYVESIENLQTTFNNKNKGFILNKIEVKESRGKHKRPIYRLEGFNPNDNQKVNMKLNANKPSDIIKNKVRKVDKHNKKQDVGIDANDIKENPAEAINLAKKYSKENNNPIRWTLKMCKVNNKEEPVYKVNFKNSKHSKKIVKLNALNGNKISVRNDNK